MVRLSAQGAGSLGASLSIHEPRVMMMSASSFVMEKPLKSTPYDDFSSGCFT